MQSRQLLQSVLIVFLLSLTFLTPAKATTFATATYAGKAHGPTCHNGFTDPLGKCWVCPSGYKHSSILRSPRNDKVCEKKGKTDQETGIVVGKARIGLCKKGWLSTNNGKCYVCPKGYKHNIAKFGTSKGVCYKKTKTLYSSAKRHGSLVCNTGHFSLAKGGSCWTCPSYAPHRTLKKPDSPEACTSRCEKGQIRNLVTNQCVTINLREGACKALVTALNKGELPPALKSISDVLKSKSRKKSKTNLGNLLNGIGNDMRPYQSKVAEIKRIHQQMKNQKAQVMSLFSPDVFCSATKARAKLTALNLKPSFMKASSKEDHFYMAYSLSFSLAAVGGLQGGYVLATDYHGHTGAYVYLGPQVVSNASISDAIGVQFFPKVQLADFDGWGYDIGVSGGPPSKIVGAGADVAFDNKFKFQGFGVSGSIGLGAIPGDVGISATHAWKMF